MRQGLKRLDGMTRGSLRARWLLLLCVGVIAAAAVVIIPSAGADSVKTQTFELEGNIAQDHPAAPATYDWANFFTSAGAQILPLPTGYTASTFNRDFKTTAAGGFDTSDATTYTIGSKDTLDVSGWSCTPANNVTDKGDIMNAYATTYTAANGHKFAYFALERNTNTGDANVAFWFLQGGATCPAAGGSFVGNHHDGDLFVVSAFTKGGTVSMIDAYRWNGGGAGSLGTTPVAHGVDCKSTVDPGNPTCATSNTAALGSIPWLTENKSDGVGHILQAGEFFEGGIDLTPLGLANGCFNTFLADTRSSQSLTATLYDYSLGNLGECKSFITTTPVDASNHANPPATTIPLAPADAKVTVQDQTVISTTGAPSTYNASNSTNLTWHICGPTAPTSTQLCDGTAGNVGVAVGGAVVTADGTFFSPVVTVTEAGRYCFRGDFAGDPAIGLPSKSDNTSNECFTVAPVQPTLSTQATATVRVGSALDDTATLGGTANEQGTGGPAGSDGSIGIPTSPVTLGGLAKGSITFTLWSPGAATHCGTALGTSTINVSGNGGYTASNGTTKTGTFTPSVPGTYYWTASYTGDLPNTKSANDACNGANETSVVVDARIHISPSATNRVGQNHTFTVFVEKNLGDGAGWVAAGSEPVTVTLTNGLGAHFAVSTNTCTSGTDATGKCAITFTSPDPGTVTGHASSTLSDLGTASSVTVATDGAGQNGSNAVKTFVDARIHISPPGTNLVGQNHTFTVLVEKNLGDGAGWVAAGSEPVTVTLTNGLGAHFAVSTNTCTSGTDATGKCAITFTSPDPGTVTGHASSTLSDLGTASGITVATDGTGQNGNDAVKTFVNARIHISPSGTNRVGQDHTFTVLVEKNVSGSWVAAAGEPVTVTLTNGLGAHFAVSTNTCTGGTDATGKCAITFTSPDTGTVTGHASSTLSDLGTASPVTVATDGSGQNGSDVVKTFVDARIHISPSGTNRVGQNHTFTVFVEKNLGDGAGWVAAASEPVTVTLTNALGAHFAVSTNTCTSGTGATGKCAITFTSPDPGTVTGHASSTLSDLGTASGITVQTDGAGQNGSDVVKTFVDARIHISPSGTNRVGQNHTFTVLVEKNLGDGAGWVAAGSEPVTVTLTNGLGAHFAVSTNTCTSGTDATGKCAITFTSPDTGTVTGHASSTLSDLGTASAITVQTNGAGQNGSDVVKTFVNARIHISPSATNRVGQNHTFTVLVEKDLGDGAGWVAAGSEPVTVTLTNGLGAHFAVSTNTCTSGTNATGKCAITFTSPDPGTVTGHASSTLSDLGTASGITVQTDGTGQNGSDAVKTFVNARIHISPSATNRVGQNHTFTVLVEKNLGDGAGWVAAAGEPVTVTLTNGLGAHFAVSTNTCTSGTDGTGKCAITFTSPDTGTVTGHASSTLSDLGTASGITVATDGTGQNGSDAVKTFVNARIHISPSATNRVGQNHTFTVLVEKNLGDGAGWVAAGSEPVTVTLTNALGAHFAVSTNTCTSGTDATGKCAITFTSPDTGTVTGHASSTLSDLGTASGITVATDGTGQNGSDAVKTFVDARIHISPSGTNRVGQNHTFTVLVEKNLGDGAGWVAADGEPVTVTLTNGNGAHFAVSTNTCTSGTDATGKCAITFTSPDPGTVTGHASSTLSDLGTASAITVQTNGAGQNGSDVVKTFVNARIHISPSATNRVGQNHTFTVLVEKNLGDGAGWVAAGSEPVTVTLTNALGAHFAVSTNTCTSGTDATGKCAITFTSPDPGTVTGHASSTLSDLGTASAITVQTNGSGQNGSDAVKTFVDARIHISPSATNRVGQNHTFTVLVEKNLGDGAGWVAAGSEPVTVTLTNGLGAHFAVSTNTCTSGTDGTGKCAITFTSPDPGTVTGHASSTLSDLGTASAITVETDGSGQNGSDAVKTFVNARIHISPSATNRVGQNHTFTVLVEKNLGDGAGWVAAGSEPVTVTLTNGLGAHFAVSTNTCTSGTDATGKCAITFTSPDPGTVTGHASSTLSDLGTASAITVQTTGAGQNGSDAVKTFVDARIHISPSATNRVGQNHTFTVLVEKNLGDGGGWVAAGSEPVTVTLTNGLGAHFAVSTNTCTSGTDATGKCAITFTSPDPGTVTGHASSTLSDLGTASAITVQTNGAGQNGSDAVKTFVDARIHISPSATNRVGQNHTFTVLVEKNLGDGGGWVAAGSEPVTVTLTNGLGAHFAVSTNTCTSGTDATGKCAITFTSPDPGTVTGHASSTLSDLGTASGITVQTDGAGQNGSDAVKTFVNAKISITPNATNGITEPHTFTVHIETDNGSGSGFLPAAGLNPTVTLTPAGGAVVSGKTDDCASTGTSPTGNCSVTFTSNSAGTVTGHASIQLTIGSATFTIATDGTGLNSGDAVKTFVQGSLTWIKHDAGGSLLGGATFQVCATGGTAASAGRTPTCVTVADNTTAENGGTYSGSDANPHLGLFELDKYQSFGGSALGGLALGTYTIQETVPPAGYSLDPFVETVTIDQGHLNVAATHIWVDTRPGQGCTPGFWKNHTSVWNSTSDSTVSHLLPFLTSPFGYNAALPNFNNQPFFGYANPAPPPTYLPGIFGLVTSGSSNAIGPTRGLSSGLTLIGALNTGGGGFSALVRHGTAALLSSGSVQYPYTKSQVLTGVRNAFLANNPNQVSATFPDGVLTDLENANNLDEQACPSH
jgi:prealbumin domain-containing protein